MPIIPEPGFDDEVRSLIKERHTELRRATQHHRPHPSPHYKRAVRLRRLVNTKVRRNVAKDVKGKLSSYKANPKKFWEKINEMWKGKKSNARICLLHEQTGVCIKQEDTANHINSYFCNIGKKLAEKLSHIPGDCDRYEALYVRSDEPCAGGDVDDNDDDDDDESPAAPLVFEHISPESLYYVVEDIDITKSSGLVNVRSHVIRDTMKGNIKVWTTMINRCITEANFPCELKCGTIIPLPKAGSTRSVINWRPITLLPVVGKVLERVVYRQMMDYMIEHELICENQFGFLPGKSTGLAIFYLLNS